MKKMDNLKFVIISRGRSKTITSDKLFPFADLVVPESEKEEYEKACCNKVVTTPDNIIGLGKLRNWILNHYTEDVIMIDDDIERLYYIGGIEAHQITDPETIKQVLVNTYINAKDIDLNFFGFNQTIDVRKYKSDKPFVLNTWSGGVIGIIGREFKFCNNKFKVDIDYVLQNLLHKRIVWIENRYSFHQKRDTNKGGNSLFRTMDEVERELLFLKNKWGKHFNTKRSKTTIKTFLDVKREH